MKLVFMIALVVSCASPDGRWRGNVEDADIIGACKQLRICEKAGLTTRGAGAQGWDRCSLICGCGHDSVDDGNLFWSDPVCQP